VGCATRCKPERALAPRASGAGKSTLATTIANRFREAGCLGAFVFFNRDASESSHPSTVIKTMAYQVGLSDAVLEFNRSRN